MTQFQSPPGSWQWTPVQPPLPRPVPIHDWYDYVIAGIGLAYILLVFAVYVLTGVTI